MKDFRSFLLFAALTALPLQARADQIEILVPNEDLTVISENRRNPGDAHPVVGGDFNQDGYGDFALGSPRSSGFVSDDSGNVFVLFGFAHTSPPAAIDPDETYFDMTASPTATGNPLNTVLAVDPSLGFQVMPERGGEWFGSSLASGDFDGDGLTDLAIGAPAPLAGAGSGAVYILYGRTDLGGIVEIDVEIFNDRASEIRGIPTSPRLGETIYMGEFNGDNYDDLAISSRGPNNEGWVYIVYGRSRNPPFPAWNLERRNVDDVVLLTTILSETVGERMGFSMSSGDFDGDLIDELMLGAPLWPDPSEARGRMVVIDGLVPEAPFINLGTYTPYLEVTGEDLNQRLGASIAYGDNLLTAGEDAWVMGAPGASPGSVQGAGQVYVLAQSSVSTTSTLTMPSDADIQISGITGQGAFGEAVAVGPWDSIPGSDLAIGEPGWEESLGDTDSGRVFVFTGRNMPTGGFNAVNPLYDSVRIQGFEPGYGAGTGLSFTNFDNYNTTGGLTDLIIGTSGNAVYDPFCTDPVDDTAYNSCHAQRLGIRAYIVRTGSVPDPGLNLGIESRWDLLP